MTDKTNAMIAAERLIAEFETSPDGYLMRSTVGQLVESLGGSMKALERCEHGASIAVYISALMISKEGNR